MISIVLATCALEVTGSAALLGLTKASRLVGAVVGGAAPVTLFAAVLLVRALLLKAIFRSRRDLFLLDDDLNATLKG
ncbi:hypothetical protein WT25_02020 [Burkholderia territorii]|nr:hypothetical protein WT25_02020 [Burkholderia territorii]